MSGNDEAGNSKSNPTGPLSLDDAERLASHFTPLWEDLPETGDDGLQAPAGPSPAAIPASAVPQSAPPQTAEEEPLAPESASPVELTPSMVAIAAPMGSSPDIDPASTELPIRRSDYAPPRPLAVPQRTMLGLAPPPPVQVAPSATTTPLGIAAPPPSPPVLHVVPEVAPALEPVERNSDFDLPATLPPKRRTGVVLGVMGVAVALCAAVGIRALFFGGAKPESITTPKGETARIPAPTVVAAPPPTVTATNAPSATGVAEEAPSTPPSAEPATSAPSLSGENSTAAAAPAAPGVELAASRSAPQAVPSKPVAEPKPHSPQRVEEAKRVSHAPRPPAVKHPHVETPRTPVSPPLPGGGAIVRQTPF